MNRFVCRESRTLMVCFAAAAVAAVTVAAPARAQTSWNAYNDFYLSPTAAGWGGATSPSATGAAWGYYMGNVNGVGGFPSNIGTYLSTSESLETTQLYRFSSSNPLGVPGPVRSESLWDNTGGAGFARYVDNVDWSGTGVETVPHSSLGSYPTPWFPEAPGLGDGPGGSDLTNLIWMQSAYLSGTSSPSGEGIASVLTWTAPATRIYDFSGLFVSGNDPTRSAAVAITDSLGGTAPLSRTVLANNSVQSFSFSKAYTVGDVVQFQVGNNLSSGNVVGLQVSIVPEPSTIGLAATGGLAALGWTMLRWRKRHAARAVASRASANRHTTTDKTTNTTPRLGALLATLHVGLVFLFGSLGLSTDARAGTIAFWSGNGNANDSVGGHNGTLVNGAGFAAGQFGQQAFSLNSGSSQYISVPDSSAWEFGSNPFSIAMLVNFTSISGSELDSGGNALMGHDEGGGPTNKWFFSYLSDGRLGFHINNGGSGVFLTSPSASPVSAGTWNLFAITRSGSTYTFYENTTSLGTVIDSTALPAIAAPLTIGQTGEGIGFVNGRLQNVQIFDTALSASEVAALLVPEPSHLAGCVVALGSLGMYRLGRRRMFARATTGHAAAAESRQTIATRVRRVVLLQERVRSV